MRPRISKKELLSLTIHKLLDQVPSTPVQSEEDLVAWLKQFQNLSPKEKEAFGREAFEEAKREAEQLSFLF